jgi:hypothetical protein
MCVTNKKKNYTKLRQKENKNKHMGCKIKKEEKEGEFAISLPLFLC